MLVKKIKSQIFQVNKSQNKKKLRSTKVKLIKKTKKLLLVNKSQRNNNENNNYYLFFDENITIRIKENTKLVIIYIKISIH